MSKPKRNYLPLVLMIGAMVVSAPLYIGIFANQEGVRLITPLFIGASYWSGLGMAVLEGVSVWYAWNCWSKAAPSPERRVLLILIALVFIDLAIMGTPYVMAASQEKVAVAIMAPGVLFAWSLARAVASPLILMATGVAHHVGKAEGELQVPAPANFPISTPEPEQLPEPAKLSIEDAIHQFPGETDKEIGRRCGVSRQRVGQVRNRLTIKSESV